MKPTSQPQLNSRLLPFLFFVLLFLQLIAPYRGLLILLIGLGGAWLVSYLWARSLADSLHLVREMRFGWAQVGDRLEERFTLANDSWAPGLWVEVVDHSTLPGYKANWVTGVGGDSQNRWRTQGVCGQRGLYALGPTSLRTGDPFGLYTVSLHYPESTTLMVTPPLVPLPAIKVAPGGRTGDGRLLPGTMERTVSAACVRDYLPGDSLRWIHWRTSARRDSLFVHLLDGTPTGDWWIFLDMDRSVQAGQGKDSTSEHAVILAASLADRGLRSKRAVGLVTSGEKLVWLPPQEGEGQRWRILRALALAGPGSQPLSGLLSRARPISRQRASLIIITPAVSAGEWIESLVPLVRLGVVPTVLLLDPDSFGPVSGDGRSTAVPTNVGKSTPLPTTVSSDGSGDIRRTLALLAAMGVTRYVITRDFLDQQPEARPGREGEWEWKITATGRAVPVRKPGDLTWKKILS